MDNQFTHSYLSKRATVARVNISSCPNDTSRCQHGDIARQLHKPALESHGFEGYKQHQQFKYTPFACWSGPQLLELQLFLALEFALEGQTSAQQGQPTNPMPSGPPPHSLTFVCCT